jgi:hypothetical protein
MDREFNFNKDITFLEKQNEWFFESNLIEEKNVFSYTKNLSVIKEELKLSGLIKNQTIYDEYESLYIDFTDRTEAKQFIKNLNNYVKHCNNVKYINLEKIDNVEQFYKNNILLERIENFKSKTF